ncbi:MAG: thrombospondin type 3 repeat-containing protein [Flavobacteriales bacterium]
MKGCTDKDTDHDFVPDVLDACPFRVGPVENKGCPVE